MERHAHGWVARRMMDDGGSSKRVAAALAIAIVTIVNDVSEVNECSLVVRSEQLVHAKKKGWDGAM